MKQFNIYFMLAALTFLCGCQSDKNDSALGIMRIHLEVPADKFGTTQTIPIIRAAPVMISIAKEPILSEAKITAASLIETPGGYAISVKFDETSSLMLEQYSASNVGKHFAIFCQWGKKADEGRWIAAPLITHHIADGVLSFTPDTSREEAELIVAGLNNMAKKTHSSGWRSLLQ